MSKISEISVSIPLQTHNEIVSKYENEIELLKFKIEDLIIQAGMDRKKINEYRMKNSYYDLYSNYLRFSTFKKLKLLFTSPGYKKMLVEKMKGYNNT